MSVRTRCQQRRAPFLHRNWVRGVRALQDSPAMGNIVSSPVRKGSHRLHDDHDRAPPPKRRRISSSNSFDVDQLIASPKSSESRSALRIEVCKLVHKDFERVSSYQNGALPRHVINTKASCRITISEVTSGPPRVLHCQSQVCDLATFKNPVGSHRIAQIRLPRPFFVPEESILINRPDDGRFDLSDSYELLIELEAAHDGHWPPLDAADFGIPSATTAPPSAFGRAWVLSSRCDSIFGRHRSPLSISSGYPSHQFARQTDYVMDVDMRRTSGFKALRGSERGSTPYINAIDPNTDLSFEDIFVQSKVRGVNGTDGVNGTCSTDGSHAQRVEEPLDNDDEPEGAQTPSRSLRTRANKVYNLKVLSDQAQGRQCKRLVHSATPAPVEGRVNYLLPSDQPVCLDHFRCVTCGVFHESMPLLQAHLQSCHPGYEYVLESTNQGPQVRVFNHGDAMSSLSEPFELGKPAKPFDLQSFILGDHSWLASRLGLDMSDDFFNLPSKNHLPDGLPSRPFTSTQAKLLQRQSKRPRALVPDIPQPLYDPISKARLVPGQEVPRKVPDMTWLIQKHRESIADFSDVTPAEKEYIWEWDGYILTQNMTSAAYLPRAWLGFVRQKADWLVAAEHRMLEFGKHASVLLVRDLIDDKTAKEAFSLINESRTRAQVKTDETRSTVNMSGLATKQSPRAAQIRKNKNGCTICQLPVLGPRMLICANKTCSRRLYHFDCVETEAITPISRREWLCNACSGLERPA